MINIINKLLLLITLLIVGEVNGQEFLFKVKYGLIHAGTAKMIQQIEDGILTSSLTIESSPWLSNLWTLSDSVLSIYDIEQKRMISHTKAIHEGSYHRNYQVEFIDSSKIKINNKIKDIDAQGLRDIPSLLHELSLTKLSNGDTLRYRLWDGKRYGDLNLRVERTSKPSLFRPFQDQGWHLTPLSSTRKTRENKIKLALLMSKSLPHKPLKIQIDTKYGDVIMRLE